MISDNDAILDELYEDWEGSVSYNIIVKEYYKKIKEQLPETLFHGTDVGHQRRSTGQRYLRYLRENDLMNTEQYELTLEAIEQGKFFYNHSDDEYRENKMVENFIREFDKLEDKSVMGIYGSAHTGLDSLNHTDDVLNMATQLSLRYGVKLSSEDLSPYSLITDPLRVDTILIEGVEYTASYFGRHDLPGFKDYSYREFWRLEYAWEDFSGNSKAHDVLPYNNYPMMIEIGQVFIIDYTKTDGTIVRKFYRADGNEWKGMAVTEEIKLN